MLKKRLFGMMTLIVGIMLAFTLIGCDTDGSNGDNNSGGLVNRSGEAWVGLIGEGLRGLIFNSDGTIDFIDGGGFNYWEFSEHISGTYSTSEITLVLTHEDKAETYSYSISGNTLTLTYSWEGLSETLPTLTRMNVSIGVFSPPDSHTPLTEGQWEDGSVNSSWGVAWYSIAVTAGTTYSVWSNSYYDIELRAIRDNGGFLGSGGNGEVITFTPSSNGTVYLGVMVAETGTLAIAYSTSSTRLDYFGGAGAGAASWYHNLVSADGTFTLTLGDNFQYGEGYQGQVGTNAVGGVAAKNLFDGDRVTEGQTYWLKITFTTDRDLEDQLWAGLVDTVTNYWTPLSWYGESVDDEGTLIQNQADGITNNAIIKKGEEITGLFEFVALKSALSAALAANVLNFRTKGNGTHGVLGSGVKGPVKLAFTEFVFSKDTAFDASKVP